MLDIKFVRENPEVVKQNIKNKFRITNWNWLMKLSNWIKKTVRSNRK